MEELVRKIFYQHEGHMRWGVVQEQEKEVVIDLGCGHSKTRGIWGLDILVGVHPDIVSDLELGLPFKDNSVDCIYANHVLEHVKDLERVLSEIHRVLKPGGRFRVFVPHFSNPFGHSDYTHRRLFGAFTFYYFIPSHPKKSWRTVPNYNSDLRFEMTYERLRFYSPFRPLLPLVIFLELLVNTNQFVRNPYEYHFCYWFPIYGIQVELCSIGKDEMQG
ncbi:MAG: methyltransferase domain-containing protein [Planctomycetes bacterium]|nr:methyltransferase domain-containing protein [Planctomycetota bacterium]